MGVDIPHTFAQVAHCRQCVCFWMSKGHPIYSIQPKQTSDKLSACSQEVDTFKHCCGNIASSHKYNAQRVKIIQAGDKEESLRKRRQYRMSDTSECQFQWEGAVCGCYSKSRSVKSFFLRVFTSSPKINQTRLHKELKHLNFKPGNTFSFRRFTAENYYVHVT